MMWACVLQNLAADKWQPAQAVAHARQCTALLGIYIGAL